MSIAFIRTWQRGDARTFSYLHVWRIATREASSIKNKTARSGCTSCKTIRSSSKTLELGEKRAGNASISRPDLGVWLVNAVCTLHRARRMPRPSVYPTYLERCLQDETPAANMCVMQHQSSSGACSTSGDRHAGFDDDSFFSVFPAQTMSRCKFRDELEVPAPFSPRVPATPVGSFFDAGRVGANRPSLRPTRHSAAAPAAALLDHDLRQRFFKESSSRYLR